METEVVGVAKPVGRLLTKISEKLSAAKKPVKRAEPEPPMMVW